jgi:thiosulfate/3-mercaptopyruvate sulfurtransferase
MRSLMTAVVVATLMMGGTSAPVRSSIWVDAGWLAEQLETPHLIVLHVGFDPDSPAAKGRSTYYDGHIRGARHVAWSEIAVTRNGIPNELPPAEELVQMVRSLGIDEGDRIVLYDTGAGLEAARAYVTLDYLGLGERTAILEGQWAGWKARDLPQSGMPENVDPSGFLPRLRPEIFVSFQTMEDLSWLAQQPGSAVALVDARASEEYWGKDPGKGISRGGHIPGAANLHWKATFEPGDLPLLRSDADLRGLLEAAGVRPGRSLVTYCRTGVQASHLYVVAKSLGYPVKLYDGSYVEWSRREGTPIHDCWAKR